jgi:hypothetical protein
MPLTVISHFWNEEFLLPYWLRHHVPLFDHGVLIDYTSTDRSVEIIHELAPHWEVRPSANAWFDARDVDAEVMAVEREFAGWKMVLNTTEFLLGQDVPLFVRWLEKYRPDVMGVWGFDLALVDAVEECEKTVTEAPLHLQRFRGYHPKGERSRLLHRHPDGRYDTGRHTTPLVPKVLDDSLFVLWLGWSPMRYIRGRKLQIQERVPVRDRAAGLGKQHVVSPAALESAYWREAARAYDLLEAQPTYRELIMSLAYREGISLDPLKQPQLSPEPAPTPSLDESSSSSG